MEIILLIAFILLAFLMGFIAAIPVGASQFETVRRSINGNLKSANMVVLGSVLSDTVYGILALFGIIPFLSDKKVVAIFWLVNAAILVIVGILAIRDSRKYKKLNINAKRQMDNFGMAFITGFSLSFTNPLMIAWWLLGAKFLTETGIVNHYNTMNNIIFIVSGVAGLFSYLSLLSYITFSVKKFISEKTIQKISKIFGYVILLLSGYFWFKSLKYFIS